jgi:uncharacterized protein YozE (UPF0346 family)
MNLELIQEMWQKDSVIDPDRLDDESLRIPQLHAKYFELYNTNMLLKKNAEQKWKTILHQRYEYYTGKADPEVYIENPFPKKIRDKDTLQKYLDSDAELSKASMKIEYYETLINYLESILKVVQNRTFQIKNAIEFRKFVSGYG